MGRAFWSTHLAAAYTTSTTAEALSTSFSTTTAEESTFVTTTAAAGGGPASTLAASSTTAAAASSTTTSEATTVAVTTASASGGTAGTTTLEASTTEGSSTTASAFSTTVTTSTASTASTTSLQSTATVHTTSTSYSTTTSAASSGVYDNKPPSAASSSVAASVGATTASALTTDTTGATSTTSATCAPNQCCTEPPFPGCFCVPPGKWTSTSLQLTGTHAIDVPFEALGTLSQASNVLQVSAETTIYGNLVQDSASALAVTLSDPTQESVVAIVGSADIRGTLALTVETSLDQALVSITGSLNISGSLVLALDSLQATSLNPIIQALKDVSLSGSLTIVLRARPSYTVTKRQGPPVELVVINSSLPISNQFTSVTVVAEYPEHACDSLSVSQQHGNDGYSLSALVIVRNSGACSNRSALTVSAIAGIAVGTTVAVVLIVTGLLFVAYKRRYARWLFYSERKRDSIDMEIR